MNINQLEYFISAAELKSFTKAANKHYLTQAAITQQIQALEKQIGKALFDRACRPIELTTAGRTFLSEAKYIVSLTESAMDNARNASDDPSGTIKIGYIKGYEHTELPETLRNFHEKHPSIMITCYRREVSNLAKGLLSGEYDIIYTWGSTYFGENPELSAIKARDQRLMVALNKNHPLANKETLTRSDLENEEIIFMSPDGSGTTYGDARYVALYQKAGFNPNIILNTSDYESILLMISSGIGVSVVPEYCMNVVLCTDNIVYVPLIGENEYEEIRIMWLSKNSNPALKYFLKEFNFPI